MYDCDTKLQNEVTQNRPQSQHPIRAYNTNHFFARFSFQINDKKKQTFCTYNSDHIFDKKMFKNLILLV